MSKIKYLYIIILSLFIFILLACSAEKNKFEDFRVTYDFGLFQEGAKPENGDYENFVSGVIKNISGKEKKNIKFKWYFELKDGKKVEVANLKIDKLKVDENHQYKIDITEAINNNKIDNVDLIEKTSLTVE